MRFTSLFLSHSLVVHYSFSIHCCGVCLMCGALNVATIKPVRPFFQASSFRSLLLMTTLITFCQLCWFIAQHSMCILRFGFVYSALGSKQSMSNNTTDQTDCRNHFNTLRERVRSLFFYNIIKSATSERKKR